MGVVRVEVNGFTAKVFSPYGEERIDVIRSIPGRNWVKDGKYWAIPTSQVPALKLALEAIGDTVIIAAGSTTGEAEEPPPRRESGTEDARVRRLIAANEVLEREKQRLQQQIVRMRNEAAARGHNWAEQLLDKCDPDLAEKVFKKLTAVLHPDVGGDNDLMRDLNVARDRQRTWR